MNIINKYLFEFKREIRGWICSVKSSLYLNVGCTIIIIKVITAPLKAIH